MHRELRHVSELRGPQPRGGACHQRQPRRRIRLRPCRGGPSNQWRHGEHGAGCAVRLGSLCFRRWLDGLDGWLVGWDDLMMVLMMVVMVFDGLDHGGGIVIVGSDVW